MRNRFFSSLVMAGVAAAALPGLVSVSMAQTSPQAPAVKTPWGEPDLQGIWTDETDTPLQRPARFANQEFFTDAQRTEIDKARAAMLQRDRRSERGTERDVSGAYNSEFLSVKRVGTRTSLIVDPPNGHVPALTPEAQKSIAAERAYRAALLQSTETCKNEEPGCAGAKYDPKPSPKWEEMPPRYNSAGRMNCHWGPEDTSLAERCLTGGLPEFGTNFGGSFRRIVQTPGGVSIFYDVGQGQGWQRNIVMNGTPHLPANMRQWYGDSRGHWEGDTLVVDVTNFSPKTDAQGARENLHLVERWRRTGPDTLEYMVKVEDPTVWTQPWIVKQEFTKQSDEQNRIFYEPRCIEGNYGLPGLLNGNLVLEREFAAGKGPDPRTMDHNKGGFLLDEDPLR